MQKTFLLGKWVFPVCFLLLTCFSITAQVPATTKGVIVTSDAKPDTTKGDIYAIITGISNYPGINPLKYADKDALLFRDFLRSAAGGSTKPENILTLINDSAKAADFNLKAYGWLQSKKLKKGDRLYIYFSGHGDAMSEDMYFFLPYDCMPNKDDHNYLGTGNINMHTVKSLFIKPQTKKGVEVLLVMDACRTMGLPGGDEGQQNFSNSIAEQKMGEIMLLSTGAGQVAVESADIGNGHGLFTYYLIDGLAGAADKDPMNGDNDGKVSLSEIGAYVKTQVRKIARDKYGKTQIPFYCCAEQDLATISKVDVSTFTAWEYSKKIQQLNSDQNLFALNTARPGQKSVSYLSNFDTSQISLYNQFVDAIKKENLVGEASAETIYKELLKKWPGSSITEDAKFSLAAKYLNFCQQKINLFLSGKGLIHIMYMEKDIKKEKKENEKSGITDLDDQIKKLKTVVTTGFDVAAGMMQKAVELLKDEPDLLQPVLPKLDFLKTMAAYSDKKINLKDVVQDCRKAIAGDPTSPSSYLLMGWIYQDMQDDSCEYYFKTAATMAPKWAYPMNGLGNFYVAKSRKKEAIPYFLKAIQLDSLFANAYRNIGTTYYNQRSFDSAKYYFRKALALDPCDSYANENYGSANADYISQSFGSVYTDSVYFKIARKFYLKSIECDHNFASGYQKLAALYSRAKSEDSAFITLQSCVALNPGNAEGFRNLGNYYLNTLKDTVKAANNFSKAISLDPTTGDNYYSLARLYRKQKNRNKAIEIYNDALENIGNNKDLFNEMGNTYLEPPSQFENAISYYNKALEIDPNLAYVYFNLGKLYAARDSAVTENAVKYYSKAVDLDPDRFQTTSHTIADYYYDNKKMALAKKYYQQSLLAIPSMTKYPDAEKLVKIFIGEKDFTGAEKAVKQYLDPEADKDLFIKLLTTVNEAAEKSQVSN